MSADDRKIWDVNGAVARRVDDDVERAGASDGKEKLKTKDALVSGVGTDGLAVAPVKVKAPVVTRIRKGAREGL